MQHKKAQSVFVGVSGGVDSSVSLALLQQQGYNVVGVFIRTWTPEFIECTWRDERRDAMRVCAHLGVPFLECDAEEAYKKGVADYMIEEYKKGNVPNPDVMCNREVKFGVFWEFAKARGADFIATGHYARVVEKANSFIKVTGVGARSEPARSRDKELLENLFALEKGKDASKDQSYFLWTLTQNDLEHVMFPIGHLPKTEVRKLAEKFNLPTATKKDSQGVCFLGPLDMKDFLKHYIDEKVGNVENIEGVVIGTHTGATFFALGERHGFTITEKTPNDEPYYIVAKDIERNLLIVSQDKNEFKKENEFIHLGKVVTRGNLETDKEYTAQVRYHGEFLPIKILEATEDSLKIQFDKQDNAVSRGQSVVIYDGDICLAGGVIL